ncbi:MAG: hypothetical protein ABMA14_24840 [Hyphomonadaceae bacterium]
MASDKTPDFRGRIADQRLITGVRPVGPANENLSTEGHFPSVSLGFPFQIGVRGIPGPVLPEGR